MADAAAADCVVVRAVAVVAELPDAAAADAAAAATADAAFAAAVATSTLTADANLARPEALRALAVEDPWRVRLLKMRLT